MKSKRAYRWWAAVVSNECYSIYIKDYLRQRLLIGLHSDQTSTAHQGTGAGKPWAGWDSSIHHTTHPCQRRQAQVLLHAQGRGSNHYDYYAIMQAYVILNTSPGFLSLHKGSNSAIEDPLCQWWCHQQTQWNPWKK